jgi:hypothetical protein
MTTSVGDPSTTSAMLSAAALLALLSALLKARQYASNALLKSKPALSFKTDIAPDRDFPRALPYSKDLLVRMSKKGGARKLKYARCVHYRLMTCAARNTSFRTADLEVVEQLLNLAKSKRHDEVKEILPKVTVLTHLCALTCVTCDPRAAQWHRLRVPNSRVAAQLSKATRREFKDRWNALREVCLLYLRIRN